MSHYPSYSSPQAYYPTQQYVPKLPTAVVDKLMPTVPFYYRPLALKVAIVLIIVGLVFCWGFAFLMLPGFYISIFLAIIGTYFLTVGILGIISIVLLMFPKRAGWYLALITACMGLAGLGPGTIISIFVIVALFMPTTLYFFKTGQPMPPPMPMAPYPYPYQPYPYPPYPQHTPSAPQSSPEHTQHENAYKSSAMAIEIPIEEP
jgi:hypothetical protein